MKRNWLVLPVMVGMLLTVAPSKAQNFGEVIRVDPAADAIVPADAKVEKLGDGFKFLEGPIWVHAKGQGYLLFSDMRLLEVIPLGWMKMLAFVDVERLRCAQKIVSFSGSNSAMADVSACKEFIATRQKSIDTKRGALWPNLKRVEHWSGNRLDWRVKQLGEPFESIYEGQYPRLSWSVHAGLTGVVNLKAETFAHMCSEGFKLSAEACCEVLKVMIRKFSLAKAHDGIESNLQIARLYPWADTPDQRSALDNSIR
jgi:hypothetical protein